MSARDEVLARVRRAKVSGSGSGAAAPVPREYRAAGTRGPGDLELFAERLRDYRAEVRVVDADEVPTAVAAALRERGARHIVTAPGIPPEWTAGWAAEQARAASAAERAAAEQVAAAAAEQAAPQVGEQVAAAAHEQAARGAERAAARSGTAELSDPIGRIESRVPLGGDAREALREMLEAADAVVTGCHVAVAETGTIVLDHDAADQGPRALTLVPDYHLVVVRAGQVVAGVPDAVAALAGVRTQTWISGPSATSDIELERVEGVHGPRTLEVVIVRDTQ